MDVEYCNQRCSVLVVLLSCHMAADDVMQQAWQEASGVDQLCTAQRISASVRTSRRVSRHRGSDRVGLVLHVLGIAVTRVCVAGW